MIHVIEALVHALIHVIEPMIHVIEALIDVNQVLLPCLFGMRKTLLHPLFNTKEPLVYTNGEFLEVFFPDKFICHGLPSFPQAICLVLRLPGGRLPHVR